MEGNQSLHITISKHIIIENSLGVAIYDYIYNIMYTVLVGKIYHTILDEGPFYRPFLVQDTCMPSSSSYLLLYIHTYVSFSTTYAYTVSGKCNKVLQIHWLPYLLEEHAMCCCIELYLRSINVFDCPC